MYRRQEISKTLALRLFRSSSVHNDPPLTILATFTVPAPISVAMRLRRVWYRSAAQIAASEGVAFVLSPKSRRFIYVPRTPRTSNRSCDAKTDTTIRPDDRSFARSYRVAAARRTAFAHARRDFVRTKVGIHLSLDLCARCFFMLKSSLC